MAATSIAYPLGTAAAAPAWRRRVQPVATRAALGAVVPAALLALWWWAARESWMPPQILPAPSLVWQTARELAAEDLARQLWASLRLLLQGLVLGVAGGVLLGIGLGASRRFEDFIAPSFHAFALIPSLAWIPLLILWLGIGDALKLFLIFKAVVVPIALHTQTGVRDVPANLREQARVLRLPPAVVAWRLLLPCALPAFMTGLRIALAAGWMTLIAVELLASSEGIGYLMVWGRQLFQLDIVFVCIGVIGAVGLLLDRGVHALDAWAVHWPRPTLAAHAVQGHRGGVAVLLRRLALPLAFLGAWALASGQVNPVVLPGPDAVLRAAITSLADGSLSAAIAASLARTLGGLLLGAGAGVLAGLALGLSARAEQLFSPTLGALRQVAIFAWVPLITAWFGSGNGAKLVFIALAAFFPVLVATWRGVAQRPAALEEVARALRLGPLRRLWQLVLPAAAPSIFAGLRLALLYAWLGSLGAEYFMNSGLGIGSWMLGAQQTFAMDRVVAAMLLVGLLGAGLGAAGRLLETRATAWRHHGPSPR